MMGAGGGFGGCWGAGMSLAWMDCGWICCRAEQQGVRSWAVASAYSVDLMNMCCGCPVKTSSPKCQLFMT